MTAKQFAEQLASCAPPSEKLQSVGLSAEQAEAFRKKYACWIRPRLASPSTNNPLIELIQNYDLSQLEIGSVQLGPDVEQDHSKWRIGNFASDLLVIDPSSGEIQVEEFPSDGHLLWECAESSSKFLDALVLAAAFLGRCSWDVKLYEDQAAHKRVANDCTTAAGGTKYLDFYLVLCGCD